jgi:beta-glucanase (GH16 family)
MLGSNINSVGWPTCGEMDIMELLGHDTTKAYGTLHYNTSNGHASKGSSYTSNSFTSEFHVYSLDWKQDQVNLLIDNNVFLTVNKADIGNTYPFNAPFFFIFNIAVGGNWPGNPDVTTQFPQWMIVDYVRVYQ